MLRIIALLARPGKYVNIRRSNVSTSRSQLVCSSRLSDQRCVCVPGVRDGWERTRAGLPNLVLKDLAAHETDHEGSVVLECDRKHRYQYGSSNNDKMIRNTPDNTSWRRRRRRREVGLDQGRLTKRTGSRSFNASYIAFP